MIVISFLSKKCKREYRAVNKSKFPSLVGQSDLDLAFHRPCLYMRDNITNCSAAMATLTKRQQQSKVLLYYNVILHGNTQRTEMHPTETKLRSGKIRKLDRNALREKILLCSRAMIVPFFLPKQCTCLSFAALPN